MRKNNLFSKKFLVKKIYKEFRNSNIKFDYITEEPLEEKQMFIPFHKINPLVSKTFKKWKIYKG